MGKIRRVMRCYCCGAVLQSRTNEEIGYIDANLLEEKGAENRVLYCNSCHQKMAVINKGLLETDADEEALRILDDAIATDALLIWVVDLFAFNGTLNPDVVKKAKKLNLVVLGTKFDLFPRRIKNETMVRFVEDRFHEAGLNPIAVRLFGNTEDINADELFESMNKLRRGHDVYMIGSLASGKTSIINRMLKGYTNNSKRTISHKDYPGTSVKVLEIPLNKSSFFYELPGFSLNTSVLGKVEKDVAKLITPKKEIRMQKLILDEGDSLVVGSLAAFTMVKGRISTFHFYGAEGNEIKKIKYEKLDAFFRLNSVKRSLRPLRCL